MIADEILKIIPSASINYVKRDEDPRDYRVNFTKIKDKLGFKISKTVPDGIAEINNILKSKLLRDPYSSTYKNV